MFFGFRLKERRSMSVRTKVCGGAGEKKVDVLIFGFLSKLFQEFFFLFGLRSSSVISFSLPVEMKL